MKNVTSNLHFRETHIAAAALVAVATSVGYAIMRMEVITYTLVGLAVEAVWTSSSLCVLISQAYELVDSIVRLSPDATSAGGLSRTLACSSN